MKMSNDIKRVLSNSGISNFYIENSHKLSKFYPERGMINDHGMINGRSPGIGCKDIDGNILSGILLKDEGERKAVHAALIRDADTYQYAIPSSGIPLNYLLWTAPQIDQIYKKTTAYELTNPVQYGQPLSTSVIQVPSVQTLGASATYGDFSNDGSVNMNVTWNEINIVNRQIIRQLGDQQQAIFSLAKIDRAATLMNAVSITFAQEQNDIYFSGFTQIPMGELPQIYGILNSPLTNPYLVLPDDGRIPDTITPTTAFSGKDFLQITRDIRMLITSLATQAPGVIGNDSKMILSIAVSAISFTSVTTTLGIPVSQWLNETYPNLKVIPCPNFDSSLSGTPGNQTVIMIEAFHPLTDELPFDAIATSRFLGHRQVVESSSISQKFSYGIGGSFCRYPLFVVAAYGV